MGLFSNVTSEGLEESQDRLGGFSRLDTDIYEFDIKAAYAGKSAKGAQFVAFILDRNGQEYRETVYVTNQKGENFWLNDGKKVALPGFTIVDEICLCTVEKPLQEMIDEEKVIKLYDYDTKKDIPTSVPMLTELLGKKVYLAVWKNTESVTEKDTQGNYVPKADGSTKETNNIEKVFNFPSKYTVPEARNSEPEPKFFDSWLERNKGKIRDKTDKSNNGGKAAGGNASGGGAPQAGSNAATKPKSLFGN